MQIVLKINKYQRLILVLGSRIHLRNALAYDNPFCQKAKASATKMEAQRQSSSMSAV